MEICSRCKAEETELFVGGVPICLKCADARSKLELGQSSGKIARKEMLTTDERVKGLGMLSAKAVAGKK
jgi:hypothetical protein